MTRLTLAGLALAVMAGCDMVNAPDQLQGYAQDYLPSSVSGRTACTVHVKIAEIVDEVDSASFCPFSDSGTYYPILVRTQWIGTTGPSCSAMDSTDVVGGIKGIRRFFGCYKRPPAYPVKYVAPCADCDWGK